MFLGLLSAVSTAAAGISSALVSSVPVVGPAVAKASGIVGTALGEALTGNGVSAIAGEIAGNTARTAINGGVYSAFRNDD